MNTLQHRLARWSTKDQRRSAKYDAYYTDSGRRGRAVIVANSDFDHLDPLPGVRTDVQNLRALLTELRFDVDVWLNVSLKTLKSRLSHESQRPEHDSADAFVLCVSSHGNAGCLTTTDGACLSIQKLTDYFDSRRCPGLIGKPKLFFIDTCQGDNATFGVRPRRQASKSAAHVAIHDKCHEKADMLVFYATVPGYKAYAYDELGSRFVRTVVYVPSRNAHQKRFYDMSLEIKTIMSRMDVEGELQESHTDDYLKKHLYLLPRQRIRIYACVSSKSFQFDVYDNDTIQSVCEAIGRQIGEAPENINVYYENSLIADRNQTLADHRPRIYHGATVTVAIRQSGGAGVP